MPIHERRQHFRTDDHVYFNYKVIKTEEYVSDKLVTEELLGQSGKRYLETTQYFQNLDYELSQLTQSLALRDPTLAHYLNLLNAKVDHLARHLLIGEEIQLRKVNISLGGMSFKTKERIKEKTQMKIVVYTKPKMIPIVVSAMVVYSQFHNETQYRTAVQFESLTAEEEELLSHHIMLAQAKCRAD